MAKCRTSRPLTSRWTRSTGRTRACRRSPSRGSGPCPADSKPPSTLKPCGSSAVRASPAFAPTRRRRSPGRCAVRAITSSRAPLFAPGYELGHRAGAEDCRAGRRRSSARHGLVFEARPATAGSSCTRSSRAALQLIRSATRTTCRCSTRRCRTNLVQLSAPTVTSAPIAWGRQRARRGPHDPAPARRKRPAVLTATIGQRFYFDSPRVVLRELPEQRAPRTWSAKSSSRHGGTGVRALRWNGTTKSPIRCAARQRAIQSRARTRS